MKCFYRGEDLDTITDSDRLRDIAKQAIHELHETRQRHLESIKTGRLLREAERSLYPMRRSLHSWGY